MPPMPPAFVPASARAFGVGEIFNRAMAAMRTSPALMLGLTAVVMVIVEVSQVGLTYPWLVETTVETSTPGQIGLFITEFFVVAGIGLLLQVTSRVLLAGFLTHVVAATVVGQRPTFRETWARVRPRLLPLLGLTLMYMLVILGAVVVVVMLVWAAPPALAVLGVLAAVVIGIWLLIMFSLATPALVLENIGVAPAFGRSRWLVRGHWWRVCGVTALVGLVGSVVTFVIVLPFEFLGGGYATVAGPVAPTPNYLLVSSIGFVIAGTIVEPFVAAVTVLLYTSQRIRRENFVLPVG